MCFAFYLGKSFSYHKKSPKRFPDRAPKSDPKNAFLDRWKMFLFLMQEIFNIVDKKINKLKKNN
ncbi:hypothetical protein FFZ96_13650 [Leptospira borgpetersenii]|nr:hypothetical protein FFZ96_13650 [Leptospira borgpetersenii]